MTKNFKKTFGENIFNFAAISVCIFLSNLIINTKGGTGINIFACVSALSLLAIVSLGGVIMKEFIKIDVPSIVYTCLLATILSLPIFPWFNAVVSILGGLQFTAVLTPILAFTGISIGKDLAGFIKTGPKLIVVSLIVFAGAYVGTALIAQIGLMLTGQI